MPQCTLPSERRTSGSHVPVRGTGTSKLTTHQPVQQNVRGLSQRSLDTLRRDRRP